MPSALGVRLLREPNAGDPPVRFDEREQEIEPSQTGLRRARRKPSPIATGRLKPLRLFSTLLIDPDLAKGMGFHYLRNSFFGLIANPTLRVTRKPLHVI